MLSGSFCLAGSGYYEVDAVREQSYAEQVAGEARAFRHPPSPLQVEVNRVLSATTIVMAPLAVLLLLALLDPQASPLHEAAQTATAGLVTLIPEGLVLLMSVTLAVAAVRLARMNTLVQQMAATEALAAVDTICVDKTGTLTDGTLDLVSVEVADKARPAVAHEALGRFAHSAGERNRTLRDDRRALPRRAASGWSPRCRSPRRGSGAASTLDGRRIARSYVLGRPRRAQPGRGARAVAACSSGRLEEHTTAGRRVVAFGESSARSRTTRRASRRRGSRRAPWWCSRSSFGPTPPRRSSSCAASGST